MYTYLGFSPITVDWAAVSIISRPLSANNESACFETLGGNDHLVSGLLDPPPNPSRKSSFSKKVKWFSSYHKAIGKINEL